MAIFLVCYSYSNNSTSDPIPVRFETKRDFEKFLFVHFLNHINERTQGNITNKNAQFGKQSIPWGNFTTRQVFTFNGSLYERYDFSIKNFLIFTPEEYYEFQQ